MNQWILLKTTKIDCYKLYNIVQMKFVHNTEINKNVYLIKFKINIEDDDPQSILDEFNSNVGYVYNRDDFIQSINIFIKNRPRCNSIGFKNVLKTG